jgi:hypothetical protein
MVEDDWQESRKSERILPRESPWFESMTNNGRSVLFTVIVGENDGGERSASVRLSKCEIGKTGKGKKRRWDEVAGGELVRE